MKWKLNGSLLMSWWDLMPFIRARGVKTHFRTEGKKCDRELVFLHGWAASSEWWVRQVPALFKDYRLILVDLPGHGLSSGLPPNLDEKSLSSVLDTVVKTLGIKDPVLIGWSLGGMVSLQYALDNPNKLSSLILVDTTPMARFMPTLGFLPTIPYYWVPEPRRFLPLIKLYERISEGLLSFINQLYIRRGVASLLVHLLATGKKPDRRLVSWCTQVLLKNLDIKALIRIMIGMVGFDVTNRLKEIDVPTLIIQGSEDRLVSLELAELLYRNIRDSSLRVIEGAGHCPHLEKSSEFNKAVTEFLNQLKGRGRIKV